MPKHQNRLTTFTCLYLGFCIPIMNAFWLPAIPEIASFLNISPHHFQWFGAVMQLMANVSLLLLSVIIYKTSRQSILVSAIGLHITGALICLYANDLTTWLIAAAIIGLGLGSNSLLPRLMIKNHYQDPETYKPMMSLFSTLITFFKFALPVIASVIITFYSWRLLFVIMVLVTLIELALVLVSNEKTPSSNYKNTRAFILFKDMIGSLKEKNVRQYAFIAWLTALPYSSWINMAPVVLMHHYKFSKLSFGFILIITNLIPTGLSLLNTYFIDRISIQTLMLSAWRLGLVASIILLLSNVWVFNIYCQLLAVALIMMAIPIIIADNLIKLTNSLSNAQKPLMPSILSCYTLIYINGITVGSLLAAYWVETDLTVLSIICLVSMGAGLIINHFISPQHKT